MAGGLDEYVFGLEVTINDVKVVVEMVQCGEDLGGVEAERREGEYVIGLGVTERIEVASGTERERVGSVLQCG